MKAKDEKKETCFCCDQLLERRAVLKAALGMALSLPFVDLAAAQEVDPQRKVPPQEGDQFVFIFGDRKGEVITPKDLPLGGPQVLAYPMDPKTKVVKDGFRFNRILLIRLDPQGFSDETRARSADGILAYSAICTHQACDVSEWKSEENLFLCPCHESQYDPKDSGRVVSGPAPRRLPGLPLKLIDGALTAAGGFSSPVGPRRT